MTDYGSIKGQAVINTGTDPVTGTTGANAQIWYNNVTQTFKISNEILTGAWATSGNLNTGRQGLGGAGTQTAALGFGGYAPPDPTAATEEYTKSPNNLYHTPIPIT